MNETEKREDLERERERVSVLIGFLQDRSYSVSSSREFAESWRKNPKSSRKRKRTDKEES